MNEKEVFKKLLSFARADNNNRAVLLQGSRANPQATVDRWQDFDILYVTHSNMAYLDEKWLLDEFCPSFGEVAILQMPENAFPSVRYTGLIQFTSGLRIDITFLTNAKEPIESNTIVLLDKENLFQDLEEASEKDFFPKKPSEQEFQEVCNEFWWITTYIAKAFQREQLLLAMTFMNNNLRPQYVQCLVYLTGFQTDFSVNFGKENWKLTTLADEKYLSPLQKSYTILEYEKMVKGLILLIEAFSLLAAEVAEKFEFHYVKTEMEKTKQLLFTYFEIK